MTVALRRLAGRQRTTAGPNPNRAKVEAQSALQVSWPASAAQALAGAPQARDRKPRTVPRAGHRRPRAVPRAGHRKRRVAPVSHRTAVVQKANQRTARQQWVRGALARWERVNQLRSRWLPALRLQQAALSRPPANRNRRRMNRDRVERWVSLPRRDAPASAVAFRAPALTRPARRPASCLLDFERGEAAGAEPHPAQRQAWYP